MNSSQNLQNLAAAMVKAQSELPAIPRSRTVKVVGQKGSYEFAYAPFEEIIRHVRPILSKNGLAFTQGASGDKLVTTVLHASGEWISHETAIVNVQGTAQSYGSALTYAKRYGFCGAFGIQADDDDDGNAADGNTVEAKKNGIGAGPRHSAGEEKQRAWNDMPADEQEFLRSILADLRALLDENRADDAYGFLRAKRLDVEEQLAIQYLIGTELPKDRAKELAEAGKRYQVSQMAGARQARKAAETDRKAA